MQPYHSDAEVEKLLAIPTEDEKRRGLIEKIARRSALLQKKGDLGFKKRKPSKEIAADLARVAFEKDKETQSLEESEWELYKKTFLEHYT